MGLALLAKHAFEQPCYLAQLRSGWLVTRESVSCIWIGGRMASVWAEVFASPSTGDVGAWNVGHAYRADSRPPAQVKRA